jgi:transcriptional regulator with XRE-family HTH domain
MELSQDELAEIVGVQPLQIGRWERAENKPNADQIVKLAEALSVSSDYLLGLSDDPSSNIKYDRLTPEERLVLSSLRRGERMKAINIISGS